LSDLVPLNLIEEAKEYIVAFGMGGRMSSIFHSNLVEGGTCSAVFDQSLELHQVATASNTIPTSTIPWKISLVPNRPVTASCFLVFNFERNFDMMMFSLLLAIITSWDANCHGG
jgi:hypothetical protein